MLLFFLLGLACILQLFFVPSAVEKAFYDGVRDQIVMTQAQQDENTQEYREWLSNYNDDAPLQLFEFWVYNITNPYEVPKGAYPSFDLLGPFTFRRFENRSGPGDLDEPVFHKDENMSIVLLEYLYHFEFLPERSTNVSMDEYIWTMSGAMQGLFNNINTQVGDDGFIDCVDEALEKFPGHAVFYHAPIRNLTYGIRDVWVDEEIDKICGNDFIWNLVRPNTLFSLIADGNNGAVLHTGELDITRIGELEEFRNWTVPLVNNDKFLLDDNPYLWQDHNETVSGARETRNFPPENWVTTDSRLKIWSIEKFRATDYIYDKDVTFKGVKLMQFRLDNDELLSCEYYYNTSCSLSPSQSPTFAPSVPSLQPTPSPSDAPTTVTVDPTISPSDAPTAGTANPTLSPTPEPTADTNAPTPSPTNSPTAPTTAQPTGPTDEPTVSPTLEPTAPTTANPTWSPVTARPTESPTCAYITGESHTCKYYQFWEDGVANLTNLRGSPSFLSKGRLLDAPFFINDTNRAFGLPLPERDIDDQYFDIDPRTGIVFRNYHNYQINFRFIQMDRPYPNNFTNFSIYNKLIPMAYIRVEAIATDEQMADYKSVLDSIDLINGFSLYGGPALAVVFFGTTRSISSMALVCMVDQL